MLRLLMICFVLACPAVAQDNVVKVSLIPGWRTEHGTHMAGVRLQLAPGWKTYWRAPGDAGIPPLFDWGNAGDVRVHWPAPQVFDQGGMRIVAYQGDVILPVEFMSVKSGPTTVQGRIDFGVCKDVCVPVTAQINATLPVRGRKNPEMQHALRKLPTPGGRMACDVQPDGQAMRVTVRVPKHRGQGAVLETGNPNHWVSEPVLSRKNGRVTATALIESYGPVLINRSELRLTLLGQSGAVEYYGCE